MDALLASLIGGGTAAAIGGTAAGTAAGSIGSALANPMASIGSAFGMTPEMMKALGTSGDEASAAMTQAQAGLPKAQAPAGAQRHPVQMQDILAVLQNRSTLGT